MEMNTLVDLIVFLIAITIQKENMKIAQAKTIKLQNVRESAMERNLKELMKEIKYLGSMLILFKGKKE